MTYTLAEGVRAEPMDKAQLGLLLGLPAAVVLFIIGLLIRHQAPYRSLPVSPKIIPVVSSAEAPAGAGSSDSTASQTAVAATQQPAPAASGSLSSDSSTTPVGGRGGGPTANQGGILPFNNTLYVPPVDLQVGSKPVATTSGSTIFVN